MAAALTMDVTAIARGAVREQKKAELKTLKAQLEGIKGEKADIEHLGEVRTPSTATHQIPRYRVAPRQAARAASCRPTRLC